MIKDILIYIVWIILLATLSSCASITKPGGILHTPSNHAIQLGVRPFYLVDKMKPSALKTKLAQCGNGPFIRSDFSIGHRGAPLQFPEHTRESYEAAARMGAGKIECDVTFTKDRALVCRHSQCDLHTTTNILKTPLSSKCASPPNLASNKPYAKVKCCTSDITLKEFKTLRGKMDAANSDATTLDQYLNATANWRTDLYRNNSTLLTHAESIVLLQKLGAKFIPELKSADVTMPYQGDYSNDVYAQQLVDEYRAAGVDPKNVWLQSFNLNHILYWIEHAPEFGKQAIYLDGRFTAPSFDHTNPTTWSPSMKELSERGVEIIAPPMWMLLKTEGGQITPSDYAIAAKTAGLDIVTWTLERSGFLDTGGGWYYQTVKDVVESEGDVYEILDVLVKEVGIIGIFSDWPATTTFYANCMNLP